MMLSVFSGTKEQAYYCATLLTNAFGIACEVDKIVSMQAKSTHRVMANADHPDYLRASSMAYGFAEGLQFNQEVQS